MPKDMSEDKSAARQRADKARKEPGLEEARLRQQAIGVRLRHMFEEVVNEPVPQDFLDILRRADEKDGSGGDRS
jgi:hypothetical protein